MEQRHDTSSKIIDGSALVRVVFGEVLTAHRVAAGFDQRPFSRIVGISNSHLRKIEAGETSPTLVTLYRIAAVLEEDAGNLVVEVDARLHSKQKA